MGADGHGVVGVGAKIMAGRAEARGGLTVLDGAALVTGAAVASVHLKLAVPDPVGLADWFWACCLFTWLSMTAAGSFIYLVRRFWTRPGGYPRLGDRLWALSGIPWIVAALVRTGASASDLSGGRLDPAYIGCLSIGLALVTMVTVPVLAARFLLVDPSRPKAPAEATSWTHRLGLALTVAWPLQCGVGLIVMG